MSPDGKLVVATSETTNMAHVIDTETNKVVANVLVDARPRYAALSTDGKSLWVTSEVGGTVSLVDTATRKIVRRSVPNPRRAPRGDPAGRDPDPRWTQARLRGPRAGQPGRGNQRRDLRGGEILARRRAGLAARAHAGPEAARHNERRLERRFGDRRREPQGRSKVPVGSYPWGVPSRRPSRPAAASAARGVGAATDSVAPGPRRGDPRGPAGRLVALLGPNGAGKTTLFSITTRLYT